MANEKKIQCPCGSGLDYSACCSRYINSGEPAPTAVALMRSRYTAYVTQNISYLQSSWHPSTCPAEIEFPADQQWAGLKILATESGNSGDQTGQVEFVAYYKINGRAHKLHERSEFVQINGRWLYIGGLVAAK